MDQQANGAGLSPGPALTKPAVRRRDIGPERKRRQMVVSDATSTGLASLSRHRNPARRRGELSRLCPLLLLALHQGRSLAAERRVMRIIYGLLAATLGCIALSHII